MCDKHSSINIDRVAKMLLIENPIVQVCCDFNSQLSRLASLRPRTRRDPMVSHVLSHWASVLSSELDALASPLVDDFAGSVPELFLMCQRQFSFLEIFFAYSSQLLSCSMY